MWSLARGRVYSICCLSQLFLLAIINRVSDLWAVEKPLFQYCNWFSWSDIDYMRVSSEGCANNSLFWEGGKKNIVFRRKKPWWPAGEAGRDNFSCFVRLPPMTFWRREKKKSQDSLSRQLFNCGIRRLFYLLAAIGRARGVLCHRMCLRWHIC